MTAELSQLFRTKREGVDFILSAVESAFPHSLIRVYTSDGCFLDPGSARSSYLRVAAANWYATATIVSALWPDCVLIDVGTTTTDIIPIVDGKVAALGRTDPERLQYGELIYTGVVRTPVEAIVHEVPLANGMAGVSAEGFALAADVHLWLGDLAPADYSAPTPDGRPPARDFSRERLARIVCADREMLDDPAIDAIANAVADAQVNRIAHTLAQVRARHPSISLAVTTGLGAFLAARAASRARLPAVPLARKLGEDAARSAPATAVALLLQKTMMHINSASATP